MRGTFWCYADDAQNRNTTLPAIRELDLSYPDQESAEERASLPGPRMSSDIWTRIGADPEVKGP